MDHQIDGTMTTMVGGHTVAYRISRALSDRCPEATIAHGSVRIGSVVYAGLVQYIGVSGILDLAPSCVNRKFVTSTQGSNCYNGQNRAGMTNFLVTEEVPFSMQVAPHWRRLASCIHLWAGERAIQRRLAHPVVLHQCGDPDASRASLSVGWDAYSLGGVFLHKPSTYLWLLGDLSRRTWKIVTSTCSVPAQACHCAEERNHTV